MEEGRGCGISGTEFLELRAAQVLFSIMMAVLSRHIHDSHRGLEQHKVVYYPTRVMETHLPPIQVGGKAARYPRLRSLPYSYPEADCYEVDPAKEGEVLRVDLELLSGDATMPRREGGEDEVGEGGGCRMQEGDGKANSGAGLSYWAHRFQDNA